MDYHNFLRLEFFSLPINVGLARVAIAAFAAQLNYTVTDLDDIKGAVSEAVSNAIVHGYDGAPDRLVKVAAMLRGDELEIVVEDNGKGIRNVDEVLQPGFTTAGERLGLGFSFIRSFMDSAEVQSIPGRGTRVIMTKRARPREQHADAN